MELLRVRVYGLFPRTRRRYVIESVVGVLFGSILFVAWWLGWPQLRQRLTARDLPPLLQWTVAILDTAPWILLAAAVWKGMEVLFVMRLFARKEKMQRARET